MQSKHIVTPTVLHKPLIPQRSIVTLKYRKYESLQEQRPFVNKFMSKFVETNDQTLHKLVSAKQDLWTAISKSDSGTYSGLLLKATGKSGDLMKTLSQLLDCGSAGNIRRVNEGKSPAEMLRVSREVSTQIITALRKAKDTKVVTLSRSVPNALMIV
jgi:hypothetical protein